MELCSPPQSSPLMVVTRHLRNKKKHHLLFLGQDAMPPTLSEFVEKAKSKGDTIQVFQKKLRLDDTLFQVKIILFVSLSQPREKRFILPQHQQLWIEVQSHSYLLGQSFQKDTQRLSYPPAIYEEIQADSDFVTEEGERSSKVSVVNEEAYILYDLFRKHYDGVYNYPIFQQIHLYTLEDELRWLDEKQIERSKALWNGYVLKHFPFAQQEMISPAQTIRVFKDAEKQTQLTEEMLEAMEKQPPDDPSLHDCSVWQFILHVENPESVKEDVSLYKLRDIYMFLRTHLNREMPFLHYKTQKEKMPYISIHEESLQSGFLTQKQLQSWIYARGTAVPIKSRGIKIKLFLYKSTENKFMTLTILPSGNMDMSLTFEEEYQADLGKVVDAIQRVTDLIRLINTDFLQKHHSPLLIVPELKIQKNEFKLSPHFSIRYFNSLSSLESKKKLSFKELHTFASMYNVFIDATSMEGHDLEFRYRRTSAFTPLPLVFDFINRERTAGMSKNDILESIVQRFGKTRQEAGELLTQWVLIREDPQVAQRLFKQVGVSLRMTEGVKDIKTHHYSYKLFFEGVPSLFLLRQLRAFTQHFLHSFYHPKEAPEKKTAKLLEQQGIVFDFGYPTEPPPTLPLSNSFEIESEREVVEEKEPIIERVSEEVLPVKKGILSSDVINFADESMTDPGIRLRCSGKIDDRNLKKGTCREICDDIQFKLRRLQQFEPKIFHFRIARHNETYSRKCSEERRPIVMANDPSTDPNIDPKSFTYALKYQSSPDKQPYYYICPWVWCPICEKPIVPTEVRNRKKTKTKHGECEYGLCPHGDHQVIFNQKSNQIGKKEYIYPGFQDPAGNPAGLCMPCCFLTPQTDTSTYKRCMSTDKIEDDVDQGFNYVYSEKKIPLPERRFGVLPLDLELFLGQKGCTSGPIKQKANCLVRQGIQNNPDRSFLYAVADVYSHLSGQRITEDVLRKRLLQKLSSSLFHSLSGGRIARLFHYLESFKDYLMREEGRISENFIWDLVSRPNILTTKGLNILVLTPHSIHCPLGENPSEFYHLDRETILLMKNGDLYEPIYRISLPQSKIVIQPIHSPFEPHIRSLLTFAQKGCQPYLEIDWQKIISERYVPEKTLEETLSLLPNTTIANITQLVDSYSKVTGIYLPTGDYLPVKPSPLRTDLPVMDKDVLPALPLPKVLAFIKHYYKPLHLVVNAREPESVIALQIDTGRLVPVKPLALAQARLISKLSVGKEPYYMDVDERIKGSQSETKERLRVIHSYQYHNEAFERYRFEFSQYLQTKPKEREELRRLLEENNEKKIRLLVKKITKAIVSSVSAGKKRFKEVLDEYQAPLFRKACFLNESSRDDPHCVYEGKLSKLVYLPELHMEDRLVAFLLHYKVHQEEILEGRVPAVDPTKEISSSKLGEVMLTGNKLDEQFQKLFTSERDSIFLEEFPDIDIQQPSYVGIDKQKYITASLASGIQTYSIVSLNTQWSNLFAPWFRLVSTTSPCDSLFYAMAQIGQTKNPSLTPSTLPGLYANFLLELSKEELETIKKAVQLDSNEIKDVADFYNKYQEKETVDTVDDLAMRIQQPTYQPGVFDCVFLTKMLDVNVLLMKKSTVEWIGKGYVTSNDFSILFYELEEKCTRFYLVQKGGKAYVEEPDTLLRKLIASTN